MLGKDKSSYEFNFYNLEDKEFRVKLANASHSYKIEDLPEGDALCFYVTGCGAMPEVAAAMERRAASSKRKPAFIIKNGDNFYKHGVKSASDPLFKKDFINICINKDFVFTKDTPWMLGLGNHDYDFWSWGSQDNPDAIETYQVLYSYLINGQFSPELFQQFFRFQLYLSKLRKYNMPSRAYTLYPGFAEIYMIDSTPLLKEWLRSDHGKVFIEQKLATLYSKEKADEYYKEYLKLTANKPIGDNQFDVLCLKYHRSDIPIKIASMHHPVYYTADNRSYDSDAKLYLSKAEIAFLKIIGIVGCYGDMLGQIFDIEKLNFNLALGAHIHGLYLYNDLKKCQIVSGGGGAKLQHHRNFSGMENLLTYIRKHGFVEVLVHRNKTMTFNFHSIADEMWVYKSNSKLAVRQYENERASCFRKTILAGVEKYFNFLNSEQNASEGNFLKIWGNFSHTDEGVDRANELRNYLNKFYVEDLETTMKTVKKLLDPSGDREHSLKRLVNHEIEVTYRLTLTDLLTCYSSGNQKAVLPYTMRQNKPPRSDVKFFKSKTTDDLPQKNLIFDKPTELGMRPLS